MQQYFNNAVSEFERTREVSFFPILSILTERKAYLMFQCCKRNSIDFLILHEPVDKFLSIDKFLSNFRHTT